MTILSNVTFANYYYQPELGQERQSVWFSMGQRWVHTQTISFILHRYQYQVLYAIKRLGVSGMAKGFVSFGWCMQLSRQPTSCRYVSEEAQFRSDIALHTTVSFLNKPSSPALHNPFVIALCPRCSDEFKPAHISASINVQYVNVDRRVLINNPPMSTGASRYFNWVGKGCTSSVKDAHIIIITRRPSIS